MEDPLEKVKYESAPIQISRIKEWMLKFERAQHYERSDMLKKLPIILMLIFGDDRSFGLLDAIFYEYLSSSLSRNTNSERLQRQYLDSIIELLLPPLDYQKQGLDTQKQRSNIFSLMYLKTNKFRYSFPLEGLPKHSSQRLVSRTQDYNADPVLRDYISLFPDMKSVFSAKKDLAFDSGDYFLFVFMWSFTRLNFSQMYQTFGRKLRDFASEETNPYLYLLKRYLGFFLECTAETSQFINQNYFRKFIFLIQDYCINRVLYIEGTDPLPGASKIKNQDSKVPQPHIFSALCILVSHLVHSQQTLLKSPQYNEVRRYWGQILARFVRSSLALWKNDRNSTFTLISDITFVWIYMTRLNETPPDPLYFKRNVIYYTYIFGEIISAFSEIVDFHELDIVNLGEILVNYQRLLINLSLEGKSCVDWLKNRRFDSPMEEEEMKSLIQTLGYDIHSINVFENEAVKTRARKLTKNLANFRDRKPGGITFSAGVQELNKALERNIEILKQMFKLDQVHEKTDYDLHVITSPLRKCDS
eukprot:TRINITY_DN5550_c0_g5_i3.p1 TRINITY_DN5550_c0_g5~~TRINITY_DN5550_c0_g5_i3.p1  ORF type:complete len:530 (-),score=94.58 TRINITY_DN5550_c0_g5_i3:312-1901(-)